jgi:hypothetical protein
MPQTARLREKRRESVDQLHVERMLRAHGLVVIPLNREHARERASRVGVPGCADLLIVARASVTSNDFVPGTAIFLELKAPHARTKRGKRLQEDAFAHMVQRAGAVYFRVDPKDKRTACEQIRDFLGLGEAAR